MKSLASFVVRSGLGRLVVRELGSQRTRDVLGDIAPLLGREDRILDIGSGSCDVAAGLRGAGFNVMPCDIEDLSCVPGLHPVLFDGHRLPFPDDAFDSALLITVLHHVRDPDALLGEASRVARKVVIQEDVYEGDLQKYLTWAMDSVLNLEFLDHPHSNRTDLDWRRSFAARRLRITDARTKTYWRFFSSVTYRLERE